MSWGLPDGVSMWFLQNDIFYFHFLNRCTIRKTADAKVCPTAGIWFKGGRPHIIYNTNFMAELNFEQKLLVFKHEVLHFVLKEIAISQGNMFNTIFDQMVGVDEKFDTSEIRHKILNVAMDLAVNSYIENFTETMPPEFGCVPGNVHFPDFQKFDSTAGYLIKLLQRDNLADRLSQIQQMDEHDFKPEGEEPDDLETNGVARLKLRQIITDAHSRQAGNATLPIELRKLIDDYIINFVKWQDILKHFIQKTIKANYRSTTRKINRRYPYIHSGKKVERLPRIAVSIDQSGSVSDELLVKVYKQLNNLAHMVTFDVVPFDCSVNPDLVFEWKKGKRLESSRVMQGGTDFNAPTKFVNESKRKYDAHIVCTDLCAPWPTIKTQVPRIWLADRSCSYEPLEQGAREHRERIIKVN